MKLKRPRNPFTRLREPSWSAYERGVLDTIALNEKELEKKEEKSKEKAKIEQVE